MTTSGSLETLSEKVLQVNKCFPSEILADSFKEKKIYFLVILFIPIFIFLHKYAPICVLR